MKNKKRIERILNRFKQAAEIGEQEPISQEAFVKFQEQVIELISERDSENANLVRSLEVSSKNIQKYVEEQKKQELINVQTSKMAAIGEMASSISHEINNPLQIIQLAADSLVVREDPENPYKPEIKKQIDKISRTVKRVSKIILSLKKLSHEKSNHDLELVDIKQVMEEVMNLCEQKFKNNRVILNYQYPKESVEVEGNFQQISMVMMNLLSNAFDALNDQEPDEKWVSLDLLNVGERVQIKVTNGGKKIDSDIREKIFDSFFTTKEVGMGTGIGLSICRKIINSFDGSIELLEKEDHTSFLVDLPSA